MATEVNFYHLTKSSLEDALPRLLVKTLQAGERAVVMLGSPERVDAPLVFIGYGFHLPEARHDDFAGLDLRGKIAVVVNGTGPESLSGALKSHARADRARQLLARGAIGVMR